MNFTEYDGYYIVDGVLVSCRRDDETINIPSVPGKHRIKEIGAGAFYGNRKVKHIFLPEGIERIGKKAFANCPVLEDISIPQHCGEISPDIFEGSENLADIKMVREVPRECYETIRDEGIETFEAFNGRYIIDPLMLGEEFRRLLKGFLPHAMEGGFRVFKEMGWIFSVEKCMDWDRYKPIVFRNRASGTGSRHKVIYDEIRGLQELVATGRTGAWFEHDEKYDDENDTDISWINATGLVFCNKADDPKGDTVSLTLEISIRKYFFQRVEKVVVNDKDYYIYFREFFSGNDSNPYLREKHMTVFSGTEMQPLPQGDEEYTEVINKYMFLSKML
ncbi:MAG: leucine-rich repeat domain-containing protein [Lachnospiraceae bacterium]|nr:leucine-rich repeat domain-containing protein [Lachnospiraceae bacterium]